jgi:hypothetical protein
MATCEGADPGVDSLALRPGSEGDAFLARFIAGLRLVVGDDRRLGWQAENVGLRGLRAVRELDAEVHVAPIGRRACAFAESPDLDPLADLDLPGRPTVDLAGELVAEDFVQEPDGALLALDIEDDEGPLALGGVAVPARTKVPLTGLPSSCQSHQRGYSGGASSVSFALSAAASVSAFFVLLFVVFVVNYASFSFDHPPTRTPSAT